MGEQTGKRKQDTVTKKCKTDNNKGNPSNPSSFFALSEKLSSSVHLKWMIIALLPVLILLRYPVDKVDYDLWWQMAHGKYYLAHHTLKMDLSVFSWTPTDPTWIYNTCLGSIAVYLFYNIMGGFGLWLFQWLIFGGIFLSFYLFLRLVNQRLDVTSVAVIAAIGIACSLSCRYYKPELFSALLFCWTVFIFFYIKIKRAKYLFYLYPLIFAFWVNLHGAFIVGLTFLALAFGGEILNRILFPRESLTTKELVHFGGACVLSGMATLLNPYGVDYLTSLFPTIMSAIGFKSYSGEYNKLIERFIVAYKSLWPYLKDTSPTSFNFSVTAWIMTVMMGSVLSFFVYELIRKRSCDFTVLIISLALYWKGMETSRASYFFPLAFFFVFFFLMIFRLKLKDMPGKAAVFSLLIFVFFFISISFFTIRYRAGDNWFGSGVESNAPVEEVEFLKKAKLQGPIFNDYLIGGYLTWALYPDYKVFIDPRGGPYRNQVLSDYMEFTRKELTKEDIDKFNNKYPFKIAILHYSETPLIFRMLSASRGDWRLLYFGSNAAVMIHKSLLPYITDELRHTQLSHTRFENINDPRALKNIFVFYLNINPAAARRIYDIFEKNVSNNFKLKREILDKMDSEIKLKEQEFRSRSRSMSPD
jgi:hypothetical protein